MVAGEPQAALTALESVVQLAPQLTPRALSRADREYGLSTLAGLSSQVATTATAAGRPERAVELLDQTRGVLMGEAIDARSDLTTLRGAAPKLADEFDTLRKQTAALDAGTPSHAPPAEHSAVGPANPDWEARHQQATELSDRRRRLAKQWTDLLTRIRGTPGFDQFLVPPPVSRLQHQAAEGPSLWSTRAGGAPTP